MQVRQFCPFVRPSVRVTVTLVDCVKTNERIIKLINHHLAILLRKYKGVSRSLL